MEKTLGQVAFEAWLVESVGPRHPDAWWPNAAPDHEAWQAAAKAVVHAWAWGSEQNKGYIPVRRDAVIEAAKALRVAWTESEKAQAFAELLLAVGALEATEGRE